MATSTQLDAYRDLNDKHDFPTYGRLPGEDGPDPRYYAIRPNDTRYSLKRHWCLLAEIESFDSWGRYRTIARDATGKDFIVAFYLDSGVAFPSAAKLQKGHTMAIMYPHRRKFLDGTQGVRIESPHQVRVGLPPCRA